MAEIKPKLSVDVNHNPTKKGIKVQFVLPQTLQGDAKAQATQKLQTKLNQGLSQYNLTVSQDTDVPYANVIGFLIPIADIKLLIKNAIGAGSAPESVPATAAPPPEAPIAEIQRMQELAGINFLKENREQVKSFVGVFVRDILPIHLPDFKYWEDAFEYIIEHIGEDEWTGHTQSDIQGILSDLNVSPDLIDMLMDSEYVRMLERG